MSSAQDLVSDRLELPSLPAVVIRLNELLSSRIPAMGEVSDLISSDAALAARVLRLVNSPLYPFRNKIDSLQRAITLIGVRELRNLALAAAATQLFEGSANTLVSMDRFWRHSLYVGLLSRGLAEAAGQRELERYFVMGLLHDIGTLVICAQRSAEAKAAAERSVLNRVSLAETEREILGYSHADVGTALIRSWHLPEPIASAVEGHHERVAQGEHKLARGIVYLADLLASNLEEASLGIGHIEGVGISDWEQIGVRHQLQPALITDAQQKFAASQRALFPAAA